jgi:ATP-binding cassette subfamily B protein
MTIASLLGVIPAVLAIAVVVRLGDADAFGTGDVWWIASVAFGSLSLRYAVARYANGILWTESYRATGRIRNELLDRMRAAPPSSLSGDQAGKALTVVTFDAGKIAGFISWEFPVLLSGIVVPIVVTIVFAFVVPFAAVAALLIALLAIPVLRFGLGRVMAVWEERRRLQGEASERMLEYVRGIEVIRAHDIAAERQQTFADSIEGIRRADIASVDRLTPAYSAFQALIDGGTAAIVAVVGILVATGSTDNTSLVAAIVLTTVLFRPQLDVGARALHLPELAACLVRVEQWSELPIVPPRELVAIDGDPSGSLRVELRSASAAYRPGEPVISEVDLDVEPGSVTALVGPSGAGKTTLLRLVAGLLEPSSGEVHIGGADIASMPLQQSADLVTAVFQDVGVMSGTVSTIIGSLSPEATPEIIERCAVAARIHDRILELPDGYDTVIGESARGLSGGERQRLAIARALCKDAPVLLLDEASSALDPTNERLLREALANLAAHRTTLVVAHRLETIRNADLIHFVDGGRIVESGTHDELIAAHGPYSEFWQIRENAAGWSITTGS